MRVPIRDDMATQGAPLEVRLEERTKGEFDLSGDGEYVRLDEIEGRLVLDFDVNRGELMEYIEQAEDSGGLKQKLKQKLNMFFEDWSMRANNHESITLDYGTLLLEGTEPIGDLERQIPLEKEIPVQKLETTSPSDMKRELRQEVTYQTTYDELVEDIKAYFEREGIDTDDFEFGVPFQIQAQAEAVERNQNSSQSGQSGNNGEYEQIEVDDVFGTKFTIGIKNRRDIGRDRGESQRRMAGNVEVRIEMPPEIGREVVSDNGSYDPAEGVYEVDLGEIQREEEKYLMFTVPVSAGRDLEELKGEITVQMQTPFTYLAPSGIFDSGGKRITNGSSYFDSATGGTFTASFQTPTSAILKQDVADIQKKISVEGITPPDAEELVENSLRRRGISAEYSGLTEELDHREGGEVTTFEAEWVNGSTVIEDTRISIDVYMTGMRSAGTRSAEVAEGKEDLPTTERSVDMSYGETGVTINARGGDYDKVDDFVTDMRNEIQLRLENNAMEV